MKTFIPLQQGFTLIEMMLVLALAAMLSLSSVLGWEQWRRHARLGQTAQRTADFLQAVQQEAARANLTRTLRVEQGLAWSLTSSAGHGRRELVAEGQRLCSPFDDIYLEASAPGYISLAGLRGTATPMHLIFSNPAGQIKLILSGKGRIRLCSLRGRWAGIPLC